MQYHGSHPEHPMRGFQHPRAGVICSICKACAHPSMVEWYGCVQEGCGYVLCWKCFEIEEQMFDFPQIIIRNPVLPHEDMSVSLRTRPRDNAHILCPLYPGRLMIAVSSAKGTMDPNETYYRLKTGGWANTAHVVRVVPSEELIEELARAHLRSEDDQMEGFMHLRNVLECIDESFRLMDEQSPYGSVMASLTLFPVMQYSRNLHIIPQEERVMFVRAALGFIHYLFHYVLDETEAYINKVNHQSKTTILTLYVELLAKSLLVARDLAASQIVPLIEELGPLVTRTARVVVSLMTLLECGRNPLATSTVITSMRAPSVPTRQIEYMEEQMRLFSWSCSMVETAGWLLLHSPSFTYNIHDLKPLRVAVSLLPRSEDLERMLCQVATSALERFPVMQQRIHDLDVLEVALSLAERTSCAESQMAVFKLVAAIAHKSPRNISQIASLVITPLIRLAMKAWNTVVANAAFECFTELAFNDPRVEIFTDNEEALTFPVCSAALHPQQAPYQLMTLYDMGDYRVSVCEHCRASHPPSSNGPACESQFAFFRCQCAHCAHCAHSSAHVRPIPPPIVPPTRAIQEMMKQGIVKLMLFWLKCSESAVANAVGRLTLKLSVPKEVTVALYHALMEQSLVGYADAAIALAAQSHLPLVRELQREYPGAAISQYLRWQQGCQTQPCSADATPGKFSNSDKDGLSPSPNVAGKRGEGFGLPHNVSPPLVDLFNGAQKYYLDDVL